jgi:hypothetical protein
MATDGTLWELVDPNVDYAIAGGITAGSATGAYMDGNLWVVGGRSIVRFSLTGSFTVLTPFNAADLTDVVTGLDGRIWFTDSMSSSVGYITP